MRLMISSSDRFAAVSRVLLQVFFLNLAVAAAKIAFGYASGAISILSDGFHSLTDAGSNVVGLVGVRAARRPPDEDHPYGHRKYETVAAAAVTVGLLLVVLEIVRNAFNHLTGRSAAPRNLDITDFPLMPALRIRSSAKPSFGTTRASRPRAVPANDTRASGTRRSNSRATAMPGYR